jgi:hypothetical protein
MWMKRVQGKYDSFLSYLSRFSLIYTVLVCFIKNEWFLSTWNNKSWVIKEYDMRLNYRDKSNNINNINKYNNFKYLN